MTPIWKVTEMTPRHSLKKAGVFLMTKNTKRFTATIFITAWSSQRGRENKAANSALLRHKATKLNEAKQLCLLTRYMVGLSGTGDPTSQHSSTGVCVIWTARRLLSPGDSTARLVKTTKVWEVGEVVLCVSLLDSCPGTQDSGLEAVALWNSDQSGTTYKCL